MGAHHSHFVKETGSSKEWAQLRQEAHKPGSIKDVETLSKLGSGHTENRKWIPHIDG